jgi:hypothetical protein
MRHSTWVAALIMLVSLSVGVVGYHLLGHLPWIDALLEASMILGGMGAVSPMTNDAVKIFASFYALFSGLMILTISGILLAPWVHRLIYHTHRQARADALKDEKN